MKPLELKDLDLSNKDKNDSPTVLVVGDMDNDKELIRDLKESNHKVISMSNEDFKKHKSSLLNTESLVDEVVKIKIPCSEDDNSIVRYEISPYGNRKQRRSQLAKQRRRR